MPKYSVVALEKFLVETTYEVEAKNKKEAIRLVKSGQVAYDDNKIREGDDEYIKTVSVKEIEA